MASIELTVGDQPLDSVEADELTVLFATILHRLERDEEASRFPVLDGGLFGGYVAVEELQAGLAALRAGHESARPISLPTPWTTLTIGESAPVREEPREAAVADVLRREARAV